MRGGLAQEQEGPQPRAGPVLTGAGCHPVLPARPPASAGPPARPVLVQRRRCVRSPRLPPAPPQPFSAPPPLVTPSLPTMAPSTPRPQSQDSGAGPGPRRPVSLRALLGPGLAPFRLPLSLWPELAAVAVCRTTRGPGWRSTWRGDGCRSAGLPQRLPGRRGGRGFGERRGGVPARRGRAGRETSLRPPAEQTPPAGRRLRPGTVVACPAEA